MRPERGGKMKLAKIIEIFENYAPLRLASQEDNCGLQIGSIGADIKKIIFTLDLTFEIYKKIKKNNNTLIYTHHPLIFEPLKNINMDTSKCRLISELIKNNICVYSAHTNLDAAKFGINYYLGKMLGVEKYGCEKLVPTYKEKLYKISVFVPGKSLDSLRSAMAAYGAGEIGDYKYCSFVTSGIGTFTAGSKSSPYIGKKGILEKIEEVKLEMIAGEFNLNKVINAMKNNHPYEEVAYDLYQLANNGKTYGYGYLVNLNKPIKVNKLLKRVKAERKGYKKDKLIKKLAYLSGTSKKVFEEAIKRKADCLIIGEIDYHQDLTAKDEKMIVLEMGHKESESFIFKYMIRNLRKEFGKDIMMKILN